MQNFKPLAGWLALILSVSVASLPAHAAVKDRFLAIVEAEILGGYSQIPGHHGTFSSIDSWLVSPTVKFSDALFWINLYNGAYNHSAQVVAQEEGGRQAETTQSHSLASSLKFNVNESWSLRPLVFADWVFVSETEDEDFGKGLYDYRDVGAGIESAWTTLKTQDLHNETRLGFRYLDRQYPNYRSLLSLFDPNGSVETDEKDLQGYKFNLSYDSRSKKDWSWGIEGIFFYKDYTDKRTINFNGIRQADTREDTMEYLNAYVSHPLGDAWTFRLDGQLVFNQSNLDFYDTRNTLTFADDNFVADYFDYYSYTVRPSLTYVTRIAQDRNLVVTGTYAYNTLHYTGRPAQNAAGAYGSKDEEDHNHTLSARAAYPLTKNIAWVFYGSYTFADSNQKFENFYLYNYDLWTTVTGLSFRY